MKQKLDIIMSSTNLMNHEYTLIEPKIPKRTKICDFRIVLIVNIPINFFQKFIGMFTINTVLNTQIFVRFGILSSIKAYSWFIKFVELMIMSNFCFTIAAFDKICWFEICAIFYKKALKWCEIRYFVNSLLVWKTETETSGIFRNLFIKNKKYWKFPNTENFRKYW